MTGVGDLIERQKRYNAVRKSEYPGWPTHKSILYRPNGVVELVSECVPVKQIRRRHYCKYCYRTHSNWWLMDQNDYQLIPDDDEPTIFILCGNCEHTSAVDA